MDNETPTPPASFPPPSGPPVSAAISGRDGRRGRSRALPWVLGVVGLLLVGSAVTLFAAGEDLFGSSTGTIDSYNRETLDSCPVPEGSTLVQVSIRPMIDGTGQRYRSLWYVYASPLPAEETARFLGVEAARSMPLSAERSCRFGQRPATLVHAASDAGEPPSRREQDDNDSIPMYDGLWADQFAEITMTTEIPEGTQSLFRFWIAQREVEGIF